MTKKTKALALLSGGLDSCLAIKLIQNQGVEVIGLNFRCPFWGKDTGESHAENTAQELGIEIKNIDLSEKYIDMLKNPEHGYGSAINPCIDCKIFMLKEAKMLMKKFDASFIITGEVLGQRPMSQNSQALKTIQKESEVNELLLRPLSAKLLAESRAEQAGLIDRNQLMDIKGRGRGKQLKLAEKFNIQNYSSPAGGCRLTEKEYAKKLKDLLEHQKNISWNSVKLLNIGRHFRIGKNKIVVGRNHEENEIIKNHQGKNEIIFEVPGVGSPSTLLQGQKNKTAIALAAKLTARYSDHEKGSISVNYGQKELENATTIEPASQNEIEKYRL